MTTSGKEGRDVTRLRQFARELPAMERLILMLRFADDLRPIEIGRVTGLTESVVVSVLRRIEAEAGIALMSNDVGRHVEATPRRAVAVDSKPSPAPPVMPTLLYG